MSCGAKRFCLSFLYSFTSSRRYLKNIFVSFILSWRGSPLSFFLQAVRQRDAFFIDSFVSICFFKFCKRVARCRDTSKSLCPSNQPVPLPLISPLFLFAILKRLRLSRTRSQSLFFFCHVSKIKNDFRANSKIDLKK